MKIKKNYKVAKHNTLNELRRNNMQLQELRFFSIYLSKINPKDLESRNVTFKFDDFTKIMEIDTKVNLWRMREITDNLLCKIVHLPEPCGGYDSFPLFKRCRVYRDDDTMEWSIEINASDEALPLMFELKNNFFTYELWNALSLKSTNQLRMYEILKQYEKTGTRILKLDHLKELLGLSKEEYPRWYDFNKRVLMPCQKALEEETDICFEYEVIKTVRTITAIKFIIQKNTDFKHQMSLEEFIDTPIDYAIVQNEEKISDKFRFLSEACNNEFSQEEINVIFTLISQLELEEHEFGHLFAMYHFLEKKYSELQRLSKKTNIKNRFSYLKKLLQV